MCLSEQKGPEEHPVTLGQMQQKEYAKIDETHQP